MLLLCFLLYFIAISTELFFKVILVFDVFKQDTTYGKIYECKCIYNLVFWKKVTYPHPLFILSTNIIYSSRTEAKEPNRIYLAALWSK